MSTFNKLLIIAVLLAFLFPSPALLLKHYILFFLSLSVLFSLLASDQKFSFNLNSLLDGVLYNYIILGGAIFLFSLFLPDAEMRNGILLYAVFPPAVGMLSLSSQWKGKVENVFVFQIVSYFFSLLFVPFAALFFIGKTVDLMILVYYIVGAFIVPYLLNAFLVGYLRFKISNKKLLSDLSALALAVVFYIVIAKSEAWLVENLGAMFVYLVALFALSLLVAFGVFVFTRDPDKTLYATMKNGGAAAAASLAILPEAATAIISIKTFIDVFLIIILSKIFEK